MKKVVSVLLVVCLLFFVITAGALYALWGWTDDSAEKADVFAFVCENEEALVSAIETGELTAYENTGIVKTITVREAVVEFSCGGAGLGSGTSYVGFYYTPDDDMTAVWCAPFSEDSLRPSGNGYEWQEANGDNCYYTEHICGQFYYYEAGF